MYSVVIPTHSRPDTLWRAVRSVLAQSVPPGEILIVDDGSIPAVPAARAFRTGGVPLTVIRCDDARGAPRARNLGLDRASREFVAFLDDDDEWLPRKMEKQLDCLRRRPQLVAVSCGRLSSYDRRESVEVFTESFSDRYFWHDNFFGSFSLLTVRMDERTRSLRLDPELRSCQDWDYLARLREQGAVGMVSEPLCRLYSHGGPRITSSYANRLLGLSRFLRNHAGSMPPGAKRWGRSRIQFYRSHIEGSPLQRWGYVATGIGMAMSSDFPLNRRLTHTSRNLIETILGFERTEALKVGFRRYFSTRE